MQRYWAKQVIKNTVKPNNLKIKNSENSYNEDSKTQNKVKFDVDDLKKRVDALFSENTEYNIVKEKVIGRTIYFMPDL